MKVPRGKPKVFRINGIKYFQLVTLYGGEETTDYYSLDEIKNLIDKLKSIQKEKI